MSRSIADAPDLPGVAAGASQSSEPPRRRGGGPRTPEGKARVRYNAMTHGLLAEVLLPAELAPAVEARAADLALSFRPASEHAAWLVRQVALAQVRLDRCEVLQLAALQRQIDRAGLAWDDDRRAEAEALGARLERDPARVAAGLRTTRQGALWLLERWGALGEALERSGGWDLAQRRLALDLLGVPPALRDAWPDLPPGDDPDPDALRALVGRERLALDDALAGALDLLDRDDRDRAAEGLSSDDDETRRLQRYEAKLRRALTWALDQLRGLPLAPEPWPCFLEPPSLPSPALAPPPASPTPTPTPAPSPRAEALDPEPEAADDPDPDDPEHPEHPEPEPTGNRRARRRQARLARQSPRHGPPRR